MEKLKVLDLFCGAGGTSTGIYLSNKAEVVACINHCPTAIKSHKANYPNCAHYTEDIRLFNEKVLPKVDIITMSAECTHFSIAKGGESRNADSRTLSEELYRYIDYCNPKYIIVENVKEFLTWSDLVQKKGKKGNLVFKPNGDPYMIPNTDKNNKGKKYLEWVQTIKNMGYEYQSRILNSADFGAYTSRVRYFGIFAKKGNVIRFPNPTHTKKSIKGVNIPQWKPCKDLLDLNDKGKSIFDRKKPLKPNTLKRILAGLEKFVSNGRLGLCSIQFIDDYKTRLNAVSSVDMPMNTITSYSKGIVTCFLDKYYGKSDPQSIETACHTITCVDRFSLIQCAFEKQALY